MLDLDIAPRTTDAADFAPLVFPQRRARLGTLAPPWILIGARWRGVPGGAVLGVVRDGGAWLDSVMVSAAVRRRGIGRQLLEAFATEARQAGARRIDAQYSSFLPHRDDLEASLAKAGWQAPRLIDILLVGRAGAMADGGGAWKGVQRAMREMVEHQVTAFALDGPEDDAAIDRLLASAPHLGVPDPRKTMGLDTDISVILRDRGALVGWIAGQVLTRSIGRGTMFPGISSIHYSGARLAEGQHPALMLLGYHRAFSRQAEMHGPESRAIYRTHAGATAMYNFTRARFAPMAIHVEERFGATRVLDPTR